MNQITLYWDELEIKTHVERLTHKKELKYFDEFLFEIRTRSDLLTCALAKDVNFSTFCSILKKLEQK